MASYDPSTAKSSSFQRAETSEDRSGAQSQSIKWELGKAQNPVPVSEVGFNRNEVITCNLSRCVGLYQVAGFRKGYRAELWRNVLLPVPRAQARETSIPGNLCQSLIELGYLSKGKEWEKHTSSQFCSACDPHSLIQQTREKRSGEKNKSRWKKSCSI